jgi:hypothetical protein
MLDYLTKRRDTIGPRRAIEDKPAPMSTIVLVVLATTDLLYFHKKPTHRLAFPILKNWGAILDLFLNQSIVVPVDNCKYSEGSSFSTTRKTIRGRVLFDGKGFPSDPSNNDEVSFLCAAYLSYHVLSFRLALYSPSMTLRNRFRLFPNIIG